MTDPKIYGWIRWIEDGYNMVPYKTSDQRLVVYLDVDYAETKKKGLEVLDPVDVWEIGDLLKRYKLKRTYRIDANGEEVSVRNRNRKKEYISEGKGKGLANKAKPEKAKPRKAAQSRAKPAQLSLF